LTLAPGVRLGPYEIAALIGAGGMGEVYRARDKRLERDVAVKILPEELASDIEWASRFEREARLLAALNHPNIAAIYGVEDSGPRRALVMELVVGPTLADRLRRGRLPIDEALNVARGIAEGIEYAHEQGVIHRDLKPANIKLRPDGAVKILDLGLARSMRPVDSKTVVGESPAKSEFTTRAGVILGTAAYMSPEQARGKDLDRRSDIFSFGGVLYEMLTGRPAFRGETATDTLSAILTTDPDWNVLPADTPPRVGALLRRCLAKDPGQRVHDIGDARLEIEEAIAARAGIDGTGPGSDGAAALAARVSARQRLAYALLGVALVATVVVGLVLAGIWPPARTTVTPPRRLSIVPSEGSEVGAPAISPDGRRIAYPARRSDGVQFLWVRDLDSFVARPLAGTEGGSQPFWSPDSSDLGFFDGNSLKRIPADGGPAQVLFADAHGAGGAWAADGTIVFSAGELELLRISASGGAANPATRIPSSDWSHFWPSFLPDGRRFLFTVRRTTGSAEASRQGIYIGSLDSPEIRQLLPDLSNAVFAPPGYIVFIRDGKLTAAGFNRVRGTLTGEIKPLGETMATDALLSHAAISAAADGTLALRTPPGCSPSDPERCGAEWQIVDREGRPIPSAARIPEAMTVPPSTAVAPDGLRLAKTIFDSLAGTTGLSLVDLRTGGQRSLLTTEGRAGSPVWSPDGARLAYALRSPGQLDDVYIKDLGTGRETLLLDNPSVAYQPLAWSHDGANLLVSSLNHTSRELLRYSLTSRSLTPFAKGHAVAFSPDDRFVAFDSTESGRHQVLVTTFPERGQTWPITSDGGAVLSWRTDGREILVATPSGQVVAYPVSVEGGFTTGAPTVLLRNLGALARATRASIDHSRLLILVNPQATKDKGEIRLLLDWAGALEQDPR
jgi:Tol biopolymer transport system component